MNDVPHPTSCQSDGVPAPLRHAASVTVDHPAAHRRKRRAALVNLWGPIAGVAVAAVSAAWWPPGARDIALLAGMYACVTLGVEVGFHRLLAHRAFRTPDWMRRVLWFSGLMAGQGSATYWIAQHRRHHAHSDTAHDPHSPVACAAARRGGWRGTLAGMWHAHLGHTYTSPGTNVLLFAGDLLRDPLARRLDALSGPAVLAGFAVPALLGGLASGDATGAWNGFLWGGPVRMFVQHHLFFTNASIAHRFGDVRFDTGDHSRNNAWCAIWTFGSGLQNTHHAFPSAPFLRQRWFEIDLAGVAIRGMARLGLAWDLRQPTAADVAARRLK